MPQDSLNLNCPHCGESSGLAMVLSEGAAEFTVDCDVCRRPMQVSVQIHDGQVESLDVVAA